MYLLEAVPKSHKSERHPNMLGSCVRQEAQLLYQTMISLDRLQGDAVEVSTLTQ